jgi:hypothetical protein
MRGARNTNDTHVIRAKAPAPNGSGSATDVALVDRRSRSDRPR